MNRSASTLMPFLLAGGLVALLLILGGSATLLLGEPAGALDREGLIPTLAMAAGLCVAGGVALAIAFRRSPSSTRARTFALCAGLASAVLLGEGLARVAIPTWPARALHGLSPERWEEVAAPSKSEEAVRFNSWGERDNERTLRPADGVTRVAFLGDSFLEEGASVPVSVVTERLIGRPDVEVVNLGVSATAPDEYFDRLRRVAGPLGCRHCCLFVFAGNDFVSDWRTLDSTIGIAAVEPRPSFLSSVGLAGWNFLLTNSRRPVLKAWAEGASLAASEQQRFEALKTMPGEQIRAALPAAIPLPAEQRSRLATRLERTEFAEFLEVLRNPDEGKFRSYYLSDGLRAAADDQALWPENSIDVAWYWTRAAADWCRREGVGLTIVVVPEAFQVDDRMREQWLPLADMRAVTASCRQAAAKFVDAARAASLVVVDLHEPFQGTRGTYLNMDGHWSQAGSDLAAKILARHLEERLGPGATR